MIKMAIYDQILVLKVSFYALNSYADFKIKILEKSIEGMLLKIDQTELWTNLSGKFNAYNLLSVISAAEYYLVFQKRRL